MATFLEDLNSSTAGKLMYMHCNYVHVCMQLHASDVHVQLFLSDSANLEPTACIVYSQHTKKSRAVHIRGPTIEM